MKKLTKKQRRKKKIQAVRKAQIKRQQKVNRKLKREWREGIHSRPDYASILEEYLKLNEYEERHSFVIEQVGSEEYLFEPNDFLETIVNWFGREGSFDHALLEQLESLELEWDEVASALRKAGHNPHAELMQPVIDVYDMID